MKSENYGKTKGNIGESIFHTYLSTTHFDVEVSDSFDEIFQSKRTIKIRSYLRPIKIRGEDDFGFDFDVELFSENISRGFEPSGIHFFFQLKTHDKTPAITFEDLVYFDQQQRWGRRVLFVWQLLDNNWKIDKIRVLEFSKWCNDPKYKDRISDRRARKTGTISIDKKDWEELSGEWLKNFVEEYKKTILSINFCNDDKELNKVIYHISKKLQEYDPSIKFREVGYKFNGLCYPLNEIEIEGKIFALIGCRYKGNNFKLPDLSQNNPNNYVEILLPGIYDLRKVIKRKYDGGILITFDEFYEKAPEQMRCDFVESLNHSEFEIYDRVYVRSMRDFKKADYCSEIYKFITTEE
jgi:hypothetical protein